MIWTDKDDIPLASQRLLNFRSSKPTPWRTNREDEIFQRMAADSRYMMERGYWPVEDNWDEPHDRHC